MLNKVKIKKIIFIAFGVIIINSGVSVYADGITKTKLYDTDSNILNYEIKYDYNDGNEYVELYDHEIMKNGMYMLDEHGNKVKNKWIRMNGYNRPNVWYYMDENGWPAVGWKLIDGKWYDFTTDDSSDGSGILLRNGFSDDGNYILGQDGAMITNSWYRCNIGFGREFYYYAGPDGKILKNTITPDGYRVDKDGKWIK